MASRPKSPPCAPTSRPTAAAPRSNFPTIGRPTPRAAISPSTRSTPTPSAGEIFDYFGGLDDLKRAPRALHRRPAPAHRRRPSSDPPLLPLPRPLRRRASPTPAALDACTARANDLMALSRERIADETIKTLALPDPVATVALMVERGIFVPVLPEITERCAPRRAGRRRSRGRNRRPTRSAASPRCCRPTRPSPTRSRPGSSCRRRPASASPPPPTPTSPPIPRALAYWAGTETAIDRLLLARLPADAAAIADWPVPRLPISGGKLIKLGLTEGPVGRHHAEGDRPRAGSPRAFPTAPNSTIGGGGSRARRTGVEPDRCATRPMNSSSRTPAPIPACRRSTNCWWCASSSPRPSPSSRPSRTGRRPPGLVPHRRARLRRDLHASNMSSACGSCRSNPEYARYRFPRLRYAVSFPAIIDFWRSSRPSSRWRDRRRKRAAALLPRAANPAPRQARADVRRLARPVAGGARASPRIAAHDQHRRLRPARRLDHDVLGRRPVPSPTSSDASRAPCGGASSRSPRSAMATSIR